MTFNEDTNALATVLESGDAEIVNRPITKGDKYDDFPMNILFLFIVF
ncbi:hypothetical protein [Bacillus sp. X1(2014)]|nr:hypothetical protein [Bacillus sp. X1(2014)]